MLKYQKAKVKLLEYDIPKQDYPQFQLNYKDLAFPTVYIISDYAEAVIEDNRERMERRKRDLQFCSEFYDAAMKSREQISNDLNFMLTGAIAYFFGDTAIIFSKAPPLRQTDHPLLLKYIPPTTTDKIRRCPRAQ